METNFFKTSINEAELSKFLEELDKKTTHKFLKILNDKNFSLADGELGCYMTTIYSCDFIKHLRAIARAKFQKKDKQCKTR